MVKTERKGLSLKDLRRWGIGVVDIAIEWAEYAFMRCDVRMTFQGNEKSINFLLNTDEASKMD